MRISPRLLRAWVLCCFLTALVPGPPVSAQTTDAFYQDVNGYHGFGSAGAESRADAERLARAAALAQIFDALAKDEFFVNLFISDWPQQIQQQVLTVEEGAGRFQVSVQVTIPVEPINLAERSYESQVALLLDSTFELISEAQRRIALATQAEENMDNGTAADLYGQARRDLRSASVLLDPIGDGSVISSDGLTPASLRQLLAAATRRVDEGVARIETLRDSQLQSADLARTRDSVKILADEVEAIFGTTRELQPLSPFYDLPREVLEGYLSRVTGNLDRLALLDERLRSIGSSVDESGSLLRQDIDLALDDVAYAETVLGRFRAEIELEIRNPRLQRQAAAKAWADFGESLLEGVGWFFLHEPLGVVSFRYTLPFAIPVQAPATVRNGFDAHLMAQGAFDRGELGIWVRTMAEFRGDTAFDGSVDRGYRSFTQGVDFGLYGDLLVGIGFGWDWSRRVVVGDAELEAVHTNRISAHLGTVPQGGLRPDFLVSLAYQLPPASPPFGALYYLNASLSVGIDLGTILRLEAAFRSVPFQAGDVAGLEGVALYSALAHELGWSLWAGLRLPPPFTIGVGFRGDYYGRFSPEGAVVGTAADHVGFFFSIDYTF